MAQVYTKGFECKNFMYIIILSTGITTYMCGLSTKTKIFEKKMIRWHPLNGNMQISACASVTIQCGAGKVARFSTPHNLAFSWSIFDFFTWIMKSLKNASDWHQAHQNWSICLGAMTLWRQETIIRIGKSYFFLSCFVDVAVLTSCLWSVLAPKRIDRF